MAGKIFLSYRREDAAGFALALFGRLEQSFSSERLFMDVEGGIGAGQDFVRVIEDEVSLCDVMLVLIGPDWMTVTDEAGRRRLENPEDFVRVEVESALKFGKRVIPVLVHKTEMPRADALPEPLKALARRNAVGLTQERFKADAQGLIKALEDALAEVEDARRQAESKAAAAEKQRAAEQAANAEEAARAEKERARLDAIAGLSPEQIAKAEELANWDFIKASEGSQEFRDHLARFPQGVTERMARKRLEALVWAGLSQPVGADALKGFLAEFPNGTHASEATTSLAELESLAAEAREAAEGENREMDAWASASAAGTVAALESFRRDWPQGKYADAARQRIREIKGAPSRRRLLLAVGAGAGAAAVGGPVIVGLQPGFLFWRLLYDQSIRTYDGHADAVRSVAFSPDGRSALSGSNDRTLKLWDVPKGREIRTFAGDGIITSLAFSPDGRSALSDGGNYTLKLWDVATGEEIRTFGAHTSYVIAVAFSPDGRTALSGSLDKTLKLWDLATGKEIRTFGGHTGNLWSVAFSPDGRSALSGSADTTLKLWDVATGNNIRTFTGHTAGVISVAFSPDGGTALSGSFDTTLKLWDLATGKEIRTFAGHTNWVFSVAFSPDGRSALSGSADTTLKLWDVATGNNIRTFTGHTGEVHSIAFSPDGHNALSGSGDDTLKLWDLTTSH